MLYVIFLVYKLVVLDTSDYEGEHLAGDGGGGGGQGPGSGVKRKESSEHFHSGEGMSW